MREMKGHSGQLYVWIAKALLATFGENKDFTHAQGQAAIHQAAQRAPRDELMIWAHLDTPGGIHRYFNAGSWVISADLPYSGLTIKKKRNCYYFPSGSLEYFSKTSNEEILRAMNEGWERHMQLKKEGKLKEEQERVAPSPDESILLLTQEDISNWSLVVAHLKAIHTKSDSFKRVVTEAIDFWSSKRVEIKLS